MAQSVSIAALVACLTVQALEALAPWDEKARSFRGRTTSERLPHVLDACSSTYVVVSRAWVDEALAELRAPTTTSCNIVPAFENGKVIGLRIFANPSSRAARLCLKNRDIVTRVHGYDMSSPARGLEVLERMRDATHVDVDLRRNGAPMRMSYVIE